MGEIRGCVETRQVFINGIELSPKLSQKVINHSPDGFNWGYGGSGPAQLALALVLHYTGKPDNYQEFKRLLVAEWPQDQDFEISEDEVKAVLEIIE